MVQPLKRYNQLNILSKILNKDVDGLHPYNLGLLMMNKPVYCPCTPLGIIELLDYYKINIKKKKYCFCWFWYGEFTTVSDVIK